MIMIIYIEKWMSVHCWGPSSPYFVWVIDRILKYKVYFSDTVSVSFDRLRRRKWGWGGENKAEEKWSRGEKGESMCLKGDLRWFRADQGSPKCDPRLNLGVLPFTIMTF